LVTIRQFNFYAELLEVAGSNPVAPISVLSALHEWAGGNGMLNYSSFAREFT